MTGCPVFLIEPSGFAAASLRRYASGSVCNGPDGYHNAHTDLGDVRCWLGGNEDGYRFFRYDEEPEADHADRRWPANCACGYAFTADDTFQVFHDPLYRRVDGADDRISIRTPPQGAMWFSEWCACDHLPRCEKHLMAVCPGQPHPWDIDSRASNCTMPTDREHHCWIRHGEPPMITVDKNGRTCAAGAGSIVSGNYHGFLQNGRFTDG